MLNNKLLKGYIATIIATILWGASFVWTSDLFQVCHFPAITIVLCRLVIASIIMFILFSLTGNLNKIKKEDLKLFVLLALFQPFLYFIGETYGIKYVGEASFAAVMISLIPICAPFALSMVYKTKVKGSIVLGAFISVVGVVLMSLNLSGQGPSIKGILFLSEAVIVACVYNVLLQKLLKKGYGAITITTYQNIFATVFYIPLFFALEYKEFVVIQWTSRAILDIMFLAILCSSIAYVCYSYGAKIISIEKEAMFNNAIPVVTIIMSVMMGQEFLTIRKVLGMLVVIVGLMIGQGNILKKIKRRVTEIK